MWINSTICGLGNSDELGPTQWRRRARGEGEGREREGERSRPLEYKGWSNATGLAIGQIICKLQSNINN